MTVHAVLDALNVRYETQARIGPYRADIYVPSRRLVIECDSAYWHSRPGMIRSDAARDAHMTDLGLAVLRLPEHVIKSGGATAAVRYALAEAA